VVVVKMAYIEVVGAKFIQAAGALSKLGRNRDYLATGTSNMIPSTPTYTGNILICGVDVYSKPVSCLGSQGSEVRT